MPGLPQTLCWQTEVMKILLIGNYAPDAQESMLRYGSLLEQGLREAGHDPTLISPRQHFASAGPQGLGKWIGYIDKYVLAPSQLHAAARGFDAVHICDHSNAVYAPQHSDIPWTSNCHDLLAVRGALGEDTDCPASTTGKLLQAAILRGLQRTAGIACISEATLRDFKRLSPQYQGPVNCVPLPLNFPYHPDVAAVPAVQQPYVLLVGSNHRRKNRETAIRAMAAIADRWPGTMVFAGQALSDGQRALIEQLGLTQRVHEILQPSNRDLQQLYSHATALVFPSRFEGFGWPIIEAQACGCPVICSQREPHPEVSGGCAMFCDADDSTAFGNAIITLSSASAARDALIAGGLRNAAAHTLATLTAGILDLIHTARGRV